MSIVKILQDYQKGMSVYVVHTITKIPLHLLAFPTVKKHSQRYSQFGCVRSKRNCEGKCCSNE